MRTAVPVLPPSNVAIQASHRVPGDTPILVAESSISVKLVIGGNSRRLPIIEVSLHDRASSKARVLRPHIVCTAPRVGPVHVQGD